MLYGAIPRNIVSFNTETDIPDLNGKIILITGGNVGLGKQTILQLSKHNPKRIYLAARTASKAEAAIQEIQSLVPSAPITYINCDLTSLESVQQCARDFTTKEERLDLLVLNAGIMASPAGTTKEGYEIQFGTNHVGHALLTKLLLPTLVKTAAEPGADVRVISLSSLGHLGAPSSGIAFPDLQTEMKSYSTWTRYGQSKLANILYAKALQKRYGVKGIKAVAVHPGVVDTDLYKSTLGGFMGLGPLLNRVKRFLVTGVEKGALNQLWAAVGKRDEVVGGEYYTPVGVIGQGSKASSDEVLADNLWEWTEKALAGYSI
ncbi:related to enoyl-CoA hydratase/isomerase [Rhynchosporium graminicola]|uniref:Related to enoyl-CoA hydratase/isomerase n=1 Tax=Rhynchosporium graminicola TaxID=2792576 RepID=A0A1E1LQ30_9HELO|nr:related to enoyl-CoA hydratase/isomerase [Rhynchosporium commune]